MLFRSDLVREIVHRKVGCHAQSDTAHRRNGAVARAKVRLQHQRVRCCMAAGERGPDQGQGQRAQAGGYLPAFASSSLQVASNQEMHFRTLSSSSLPAPVSYSIEIAPRKP